MITQFEITRKTKTGHSYGWFVCPICNEKIDSRVNKSYLDKINSCKKCTPKLKLENYNKQNKFKNGIKKSTNCKDCNCILTEQNIPKNARVYNKCYSCYLQNIKKRRSKPENKIKTKEYSIIFREKNWHKVLFTRLKRRTKDTDITAEFILELWEKQNGLCYWFNIPMTITSKKKFPSKPSVDRLDNSKPYSKDNCVLCCYSANIGRNENNTEDWLDFINTIRKSIINESKNENI